MAEGHAPPRPGGHHAELRRRPRSGTTLAAFTFPCATTRGGRPTAPASSCARASATASAIDGARRLSRTRRARARAGRRPRTRRARRAGLGRWARGPAGDRPGPPGERDRRAPAGAPSSGAGRVLRGRAEEHARRPRPTRASAAPPVRARGPRRASPSRRAAPRAPDRPRPARAPRSPRAPSTLPPERRARSAPSRASSASPEATPWASASCGLLVDDREDSSVEALAGGLSHLHLVALLLAEE